MYSRNVVSSLSTAVVCGEPHQSSHSHETCISHHHGHDDDFSDLSEYSDSEDVPGESRFGFKVWDYFFILKTDVIKGLDKCKVIFRREKNVMLHKFEREKSAQPFVPTHLYRAFMKEEMDRYIKVKAQIFYKNSKHTRVLKVKLMDVAQIHHQRELLKLDMMKKKTNPATMYKEAKALKLQKMRQLQQQQMKKSSPT